MRAASKRRWLPADGVILDLEDAVAVAEKPRPAPVVTEAFGKPRAGKLYVRVNALTTEWCHGDIVAVVAAGLDGIILPKVEHAHELRTADWLIANLERERGLPAGGIDLIPIIETALGISNLSADLPVRHRASSAWRSAPATLPSTWAWSGPGPKRNCCRTGPPACWNRAPPGLEPPLDTVWADLRDADGFIASAKHAAALGFQGKMCIHPDQIAPANAAFTPDEAAVAQAKRIVSAFDEAEAQGLASIQLDGQFIDYPIVQRARRVLAAAR